MVSLTLIAACATLILHSSAAPSYDQEGFDDSMDKSNIIPQIVEDKRASNLGGRMCQLDSRNCGAFNLGKKFVSYNWLRPGDLRERRDHFYPYRNVQELPPSYQRGINPSARLGQEPYWPQRY